MKKFMLILLALIFAGFSLIVFFDIDLKGGKDSAETVSFRLNSGEQVSGRVVERNDSCIVLGSSWFGRREYPYKEILADTLGSSMHESLLKARIAGRWGYLDRRGRVAVTPVFISAGDFHEGLAAAKKERKFGYIDTLGSFVIQPSFDMAMSFSEGRAMVLLSGGMFYIDRSGRIVFEANKPDNPLPLEFNNGLVPHYSRNGRWGYVDTEGNLAIDAGFDSAAEFREGLAVVEREGLFGYIDTAGNIVLDFQFHWASQFSEGYACVSWPQDSGKVNLCRLIDMAGNTVLDTSFLLSSRVVHGIAPVFFAVGPEDDFSMIGEFWKVEESVRLETPRFGFVFPFSQGLAAVEYGERWGYIDTTGSTVIEPAYELAGMFCDDRAVVKRDGGWLLINKKGEVVYGFLY